MREVSRCSRARHFSRFHQRVRLTGCLSTKQQPRVHRRGLGTEHQKERKKEKNRKRKGVGSRVKNSGFFSVVRYPNFVVFKWLHYAHNHTQRMEASH